MNTSQSRTTHQRYYSDLVYQKLLQSIKRSTAIQYYHHFQKYHQFCNYIHVDPLPLSYGKLSKYYIFYCNQHNPHELQRTARSLKTIKAALVKVSQLYRYPELPPNELVRLSQLHQALLRNDAVPTHTKIAVTYYWIRRAHKQLNFDIPADMVFFTLMIVGHDGLLRIAELLRLRWEHVTWLDTDTVRLTLHRSKMNKTADPEFVILKRYHYISGVSFLQRYMAGVSRRYRIGPLFQMQDDMVNRRLITAFCQDVLNLPHHQHGFSFRGGGATDLYNSSQNPSLVKHAGRWKSDAYLRYCRIDREHIGSLAALHFQSYS